MRAPLPSLPRREHQEESAAEGPRGAAGAACRAGGGGAGGSAVGVAAVQLTHSGASPAQAAPPSSAVPFLVRSRGCGCSSGRRRSFRALNGQTAGPGVPPGGTPVAPLAAPPRLAARPCVLSDPRAQQRPGVPSPCARCTARLALAWFVFSRGYAYFAGELAAFLWEHQLQVADLLVAIQAGLKLFLRA